jgi:probable HAF family extracellular repeat protein
MVDLGTLGGWSSYGFAINAAGQVAGWSHTTGGENGRAFLYTGTPGADGQMINLDTWLDAVNPIEGAKWTLKEANGVTDSGLITGHGNYYDGPGAPNNGVRAFLLDASALTANLAGDYNGDGNVDAADYVHWRRNDGTPAAYQTWRANFGMSVSVPGVGAVYTALPEPTVLVQLMMAAISLLPLRSHAFGWNVHRCCMAVVSACREMSG